MIQVSDSRAQYKAKEQWNECWRFVSGTDEILHISQCLSFPLHIDDDLDRLKFISRAATKDIEVTKPAGIDYVI